jgi:anti-anti-sigma regulatory factor
MRRDKIMDSGTSSNPNLTTIDCGAELCIGQLDDLRAKLLEALDSSVPVTLNVSALQQIDTAALQLLTAFVQDAKRQDLAVTWQAPSGPLKQAAELLGVGGFLGL